jgi:scyllo-inositol 2-dehydrogenase (NADP+)
MLKGGLIGLGRMGITHFAILNNHPQVRLVGACDSSAFVLKSFQAYCPIQVFTDYKQLISSLDLDFVIISTPPASHIEILEACVQRGLAVFVEKPLSCDWRAGQAVVELTIKNQLVNQVGYVNRFNEIFRTVKSLLDRGVLGKLTHFSCDMHASTVTRPSGNGWRSSCSEGGCLRDFGSHGIDLVTFLIGQPAKPFGTVLKRVFSREVDDVVSTTFLYANGLTGRLLVDWTDSSYRKPAYRLEIIGENGKLMADQHSYKVFLKTEDRLTGYKQGWNVRYITDHTEPVRFYVRGNEFTTQLDYFVDRVLTRNPENISSFAEAVQTDRIIHEMFADRGTAA